jgi:hypothetical protein
VWPETALKQRKRQHEISLASIGDFVGIADHIWSVRELLEAQTGGWLPSFGLIHRRECGKP